MLSEVTAAEGGIILFIDEMHTLIGAGKADGAMDASNLLEAGAGARRTALHRRHHARRISQARRKGRRSGAPLPADLRLRADGRGHHLDPARAEGQIRAAPRRAHRRLRAGGGRHAVEPLHHRPLPARQGDRPDGRGRGAAEDAGRFQAGRTRFDGPRDRAAQDRAGGAEEGDRRRLQDPAADAGKGARRARGEVRGADAALERGEEQALRRPEAEERTRRLAARTRRRAASRRISARRRTGLWPDSRAGEAARRHRSQRERRRDDGGGGHRQPHRAGGVALDRRAGRQDARGREGKAAADGRPDRQARGRPVRGRACGVDRGPPCPRRAAGPEPADGLVHVLRPDRRRQDRADQGAGRVSVRRRDRDGPPRHVGIHGEALGLAADRRASGLCRLRRGRRADRSGAAPAVSGRAVRRDREGASGRVQRAAAGARRRPPDRRSGPHRRLPQHADHHDVESRLANIWSTSRKARTPARCASR